MLVDREKGKAQQDDERRALWGSVMLRYRAAGHARFDLPPQLCDLNAAGLLETGMRELEGVYRVTVFPSFGKLSIRWAEAACDFTDIVRRLATVVSEVARRKPSTEPAARPATEGWTVGSLVERIRGTPVVRRLRARYDDAKAKADLLSRHFASRMGRKAPRPFDPREWIHPFINDLVAFYLIRVHWTRITTQWLPNPWRFRYDWLTLIYLTFLLVRYRRTAAPKAKK